MTINEYLNYVEESSTELRLNESSKFFNEVSSFINQNIVELDLPQHHYLKEETEKKEETWFTKAVNAVVGFFKWIWKQIIKFVMWLLGLKDSFVYKVRALKTKYGFIKNNIETDYKRWKGSHSTEDTKEVLNFFNLSKESDSNEFKTIIQEKIENNQKLLTSIEGLGNTKWVNESSAALKKANEEFLKFKKDYSEVQGAETNTGVMDKLFKFVIEYLTKVDKVLTDECVKTYYLDANNYINSSFYDMLSITSIMLGSLDSLGGDIIDKISKNKNLEESEKVVVKDRFKIINDALEPPQDTEKLMHTCLDCSFKTFINKFIFWNFALKSDAKMKYDRAQISLTYIEKKKAALDKLMAVSDNLKTTIQHRRKELEDIKKDGLTQKDLKSNLKIFKEDKDAIDKRIQEIKFKSLYDIAESDIKTSLNQGFDRLQHFTVLMMNMYNIMVANYNFNVQLDHNICAITLKHESEGEKVKS